MTFDVEAKEFKWDAKQKDQVTEPPQPSFQLNIEAVNEVLKTLDLAGKCFQ